VVIKTSFADVRMMELDIIGSFNRLA